MDNGRSPRRRSRARAARVSLVVAIVPALVVVQASREGAYRSNDRVRQQIPTVWDEEALEDFELPPPGADFEVEHVTPEYYYAIRERVIHKTYPVYHPDFEPPGYLDSLRTLAPQTVLDTDTLDNEAEWIRAGELVFDAPQLFFELEDPFSVAAVAEAGVPADADGVIPNHQYVVLADGDVRLGAAACANCHTRVMPDGSVLKAVQGEFPLDRILAQIFRNVPEQIVAAVSREQFGAPWVDHPSQEMLDTLSVERAIELYAAIPDGAPLRQGAHFFYPAKVPDSAESGTSVSSMPPA